MAAGNDTRSSTFHPEHLVARRNYSQASTYPCGACERVVTGTGYRCDECDFHIHEACLSLPQRATLDAHPGGHVLTLTRLRASRCCNLCKVASHAGRYMYLCSPCNFAVHPRCTSLVARPPQAQAAGGRRRRGGTISTVITIGFFAFRVGDSLTGGSFSGAIDNMEEWAQNFNHEHFQW